MMTIVYAMVHWLRPRPRGLGLAGCGLGLGVCGLVNIPDFRCIMR